MERSRRWDAARRRPVLVRGAWLAVWLLAAAPPAGAHDASVPIAADGIVLLGPPEVAAGSESFSFASSDPDVLASHDPALAPTAVLVRGEGAAGRSPLVSLDPTRWSPSGDGFAYGDPGGARGGLTAATLQNGALSFQAGSGWPWSPEGAQDAVWVHFRVEDEWYCARFPAAGAAVNQVGHFASGAAPAPAACPEAVCGNGAVEPGEECDDGDLVEDDGCSSACRFVECASQEFTSTYQAIQERIFDEPRYGCSAVTCHHPATAALAGNLDLSADASYAALLGPDRLGAPSTGSPMRRVEPVDPQLSFLYRKLATRLDPDLVEIPLAFPTEGFPMPREPFFALAPEHLEALRLWIRAGAPPDTVVDGTASLLDTCLPPPDPQKIPVPAPPPPDPQTGEPTGFQLQQPPWPLLGRTASSQGEDEICMATYYDLSAVVPEWARMPCPAPFALERRCRVGGPAPCSSDAECPGEGNACAVARNATNPTSECLVWHRQVLKQDPQSHHSIVTIYTGASDTTDPAWGAWSRRSDDPADPCYPLRWPDRNSPPPECACDPTAIDPARGFAPGCSGGIESQVACIGFGPADAGNFNLAGGGSNQLTLSQEPIFDLELADGVYSVLPLRGIVNWNSHAFNLSPTDSTLAQYLNVHFAGPADQETRSQQLFDARWIFAESVPPFETLEICGTYTFEPGSRLFQLSSHTHERGVHWRTWLPPNEQCRPPCLGSPATTTLFGCDLEKVCVGPTHEGRSCTSEDPSFCGAPELCVLLPECEGPREDPPLYRSTEYADPLNLTFDPPLAFDAPDPRDRTLLYCSEFDNGATPRAPIKRRSTSSTPPALDFGPLVLDPVLLEPLLGGPCRDHVVACLDGPKRGQPCGREAGPDAFCGLSESCPTCVCDACPAHGGITTTDEMFILLGDYYLTPEPSSAALGLAALGAAGLLARARRARDRVAGG
jgi:cysteine-rich repeat protein